MVDMEVQQLLNWKIFLKKLEQAYHVFLTGTGFGGVALALMSFVDQEMKY